jgi:hypothetical protein
MPDPAQPAVRSIILGNDALLAARPAAPLQLLNACARAGFDFVAPVSWGEELLAMRAADWVRRHAPVNMIVAHCPYVAESLRAVAPTEAVCLTAVAPPVATARYLRSVFAPRPLHIVYAGACPGAAGPDIDEVLFPEVLLARFADARIVLAEEPAELDSRLPPERARHASLPGGAPAPGWLAATTGAVALEVAPVTLSAAPRAAAAEAVVLDLHAACGCVCAAGRPLVARLEPPRAALPVVLESVGIDLEDGPPLGNDGSGLGRWKVAGTERESPVETPASAAESRPPAPGVAYAPRGLGGPGEESSSRRGLERLTGVVEPWLEPPSAPRDAFRRAPPGGEGDRPAIRPASQRGNGAERSDIDGTAGATPRDTTAGKQP